MPIKKSELYSSLWKSCDELRGGMDASQYKDYVLVPLFVKYVSDKYADVSGAPIEIGSGKRRRLVFKHAIDYIMPNRSLAPGFHLVRPIIANLKPRLCICGS